ncbi:MAG: alpha/beta fold hydrolase [Pseudomonadota bacterium]
MTEATFQSIQLDRPDGQLCGIALGDQPDLLLLHAGGEHAGVFKTVMRGLLDAGFGSIAYDQRGHGRSLKEGADSLPNFADDAAAMLAPLNKPVAVGCSLGGLSLISGISKMGRAANIAGLVLLDVTPELNAPAVDGFLDGAQEIDPGAPLVRDIISRADDLRDACRQLSLPLLLVRAGKDTPLTDASVEHFLGYMPHANVLTIPDATHLVAQSAPEALTDVLIDVANTHKAPVG